MKESSFDFCSAGTYVGRVFLAVEVDGVLVKLGTGTAFYVSPKHLMSTNHRLPPYSSKAAKYFLVLNPSAPCTCIPLDNYSVFPFSVIGF